MKLKFSGPSNSFIGTECIKLQQNLRESPGELVKDLLSWHGIMTHKKKNYQKLSYASYVGKKQIKITNIW